MGAWGVKINQNDTYYDVVETMNALIRSGVTHIDAANRIYLQYKGSPDCTFATLAIIDALWHYNKITDDWKSLAISINKNEEDSAVCYENGADEGLIKKRKQALAKFIVKIGVPPTPKQMWNPNFRIGVEPQKGDCFWYKSKGKIYGAIIADSILGFYLVGISQELKKTPHKVSDILNCEAYTFAWFPDTEMLSSKRRHNVSCVEIESSYNGCFGFSYDKDLGLELKNIGQSQTWSHEFLMLSIRMKLSELL